MTIIDVHCHVVPESFPTAPNTGRESRWPCVCHGTNGQATVMVGEQPFRKIDRRSWDPAVRLRDMDAAHVSRQVLSPMPELLSYWFAPDSGLEMCRWMNDYIADIVARHPDRFSGLGIVPLQDPALAARELSMIAESGFAGVEVGSNINGKFLGENDYQEFFAEAERLDLCVFVHALHPIGVDRLKNMPDLVPFAAFPLDTALCAASLIRSGIPEQHPQLRLGFSHGGGAIIPLAHRLARGARLTENFGGTLTKSPPEYAAEFFYDSLVYDHGYLAYLANSFAPGQVFCGTDYPYPIMDANPADFIAAAPLTHPESVRREAALRFIGPRTLT